MEYIAAYWVVHWLRLALVLAVIGGFYKLSGHIHSRLFRHSYRDFRLARTREWRARFWAPFLFIWVAVLTLAIMPLFHLCGTPWLVAVDWVLTVPVTFVAVYADLGGEYDALRVVGPLSHLSFSRRPFNAAEMSVQPRESDNEVARYSRLVESSGGKRADPVVQFINRGAVGRWCGYAGFFRNLSTILGEAPVSSLELYDRTLHAIEHAIDEIRKEKPNAEIITTDAEYPDVLRLAKSKFGTPTVVAVQEAIWEGASEAEVRNLIRSKAEKADKDTVLLVAHCFYATGLCLDVASLVNGLPKTVYLVCDGAQALGQVPISSSVMERAHYYASCTHKWLLGKETLGVLYRNSALLEGAGIRIQKNTRGLSRCDEGPSSSEAAGTISLEPYISASVPLQEINRLTAEACHKHSRSLAERFAQQAVSRGLGRCLVGSAGSTVLLKPHGQASKVNEQLSRSGVPGTVIRQTISASEELGIRLAFHYYHGEHDLINLLEQLECQLL